jgi:hypothetical protein
MPPSAIPPPSPAALPWEEPTAGFGSIFPTVVEFVTAPFQAFGKMSLTIDLVRPIAYFVVFALFNVAIGQVWRFVFWSPETSGMELIPKEIFQQAPWLQSLIARPSLVVVAVLMVIAPLVNLIFLFIWSGIIHLFLMMVGGAASGFAATLRVICYSQTAGIAAIVPFVGGIIQLVWGLVLQIMGLSQAHRTTGGKAAFAVIAPLVLCCGCVIVLAIAGATAFKGMLNH